MGRKRMIDTCIIDGCTTTVLAKGLCRKHWERKRKTGRYDLISPIERCFQKIKINEGTGCWEWTGHKRKNGYGFLCIGSTRVSVHRYVYEFYYGKISDRLCACHTCDNPSCVNPMHIFLGTQQDNIRDAVVKSRIRGPHNPHRTTKLVESDVISILQDDRIHRVIAQEYNVSKGTIGDIKRGTTWRYLQKKAAIGQTKLKEVA